MSRADRKFFIVCCIVLLIIALIFTLIVNYAPERRGYLDYSSVLNTVGVVVTVIAFAFSLILLVSGLKTLSTERKINSLMADVQLKIEEMQNKDMVLSYAIEVATISCETSVELTEIMRDQIAGIVESEENEGDAETKNVMMRLHLLRQLGIAISADSVQAKIRAVREIIGGIGPEIDDEHREYFYRRIYLICDELMKGVVIRDNDSITAEELEAKENILTLYVYAKNKHKNTLG